MDMYVFVLQKQLYYLISTDDIVKPQDISQTIVTIKGIISDKNAPEAELKAITSYYEQFRNAVITKIAQSQDDKIVSKLKELLL